MSGIVPTHKRHRVNDAASCVTASRPVAVKLVLHLCSCCVGALAHREVVGREDGSRQGVCYEEIRQKVQEPKL